jgi:hypothetical protein
MSGRPFREPEPSKITATKPPAPAPKGEMLRGPAEYQRTQLRAVDRETRTTGTASPEAISETLSRPVSRSAIPKQCPGRTVAPRSAPAHSNNGDAPGYSAR